MTNTSRFSTTSYNLLLDAGPRKDKTGQQFHLLHVVEYAGYVQQACGKKARYWLCRCDCGTEKVVSDMNLTRGEAKSCGCYQKASVRERSVSHDKSFTGTYRSWSSMKQRCNNPNHTFYYNYGGRGISVCERWMVSFENFLEDMGDRPPGMTLDRENENGNYEPGNCRWATDEQQLVGKRKSIKVLYDGEIMCLSTAAKKAGLNVSTVKTKYRRGMPIDQILPGCVAA